MSRETPPKRESQSSARLIKSETLGEEHADVPFAAEPILRLWRHRRDAILRARSLVLAFHFARDRGYGRRLALGLARPQTNNGSSHAARQSTLGGALDDARRQTPPAAVAIPPYVPPAYERRARELTAPERWPDRATTSEARAPTVRGVAPRSSRRRSSPRVAAAAGPPRPAAPPSLSACRRSVSFHAAAAVDDLEQEADRPLE